MFDSTKCWRAVPVIAFMLTVVTGAGCGAFQRSFPEPHELMVEQLPSESHRLKDILVQQISDEMVIYGQVEPLVPECDQAGHVDIAVVDPFGAVVLEASVTHLERGSKHRGWSSADFRGRFLVIPPEGSRLVLAYHLGLCQPVDQLDCGSNRAVESIEH